MDLSWVQIPFFAAWGICEGEFNISEYIQNVSAMVVSMYKASCSDAVDVN